MIQFAMFFGSRLYAGEKNGTEICITAAGRLLYHGVKRNDIIAHKKPVAGCPTRATDEALRILCTWSETK